MYDCNSILKLALFLFSNIKNEIKETLEMGVMGWIIIGAIAGWIASMFTRNDKQMGAGLNIIVGIIGGFIGGFVMNLIGGSGITGFNVWSLLVATVGAVILLMIVNALKRKR